MTNHTINASINRTARIAGFMYLMLLPLGIFGMAVSSSLVVPGDAATTTQNILTSESLFRLSSVSALLVQIINVFVVLALYQLLKPAGKMMARSMVLFLLLGVPIAMLNELNQFAVLLVLHSGSQSQVLIPLFLDLHQLGISIASIFWGLWLFPMGYLVYKSGYLPRILGILLIVGCLGYLIDSFAVFLLPNYKASVALFTFWGEVLFPLWLLIKGVNVEQWKKRALASA